MKSILDFSMMISPDLSETLVDNQKSAYLILQSLYYIHEIARANANFDCGFGFCKKQNTNGIVVELRQNTLAETTYSVLLESKDGYNIFGGVIMSNGETTGCSKDNSLISTAVCMAIIIETFKKSAAYPKEKKIIYDTAKTIYHIIDGDITFASLHPKKNPLLTSINTIYTTPYGIQSIYNKCKIFSEQKNIENLSSAVIKKIAAKPYKGYFKYFHDYKPIEKIPVQQASEEALPSTLEEEGSHMTAYTEEEQKLIPIMPSWYIDTTESNFAARMYQENNQHKVRNIMLRGPSSTGKTTMARAIASKLGLPYVFVTCNQDTDSYALIGQPMYDRKGNIHYVDSPLIQGIKNGYLVELQEPLVVAKQGIFTVLNALMDDTNAICLPTGEIIKRDPRALLILTTNTNYVGCHKMNQSVLRRMDLVMDILPADSEDTIKRIMAATSEQNKNLVKKLVNIQKDICLYLEKEDIQDGVCGITELINWINAYHLTGDLLNSASYTFVSKCSDDPEIRKAIFTQIETVLSDTTN